MRRSTKGFTLVELIVVAAIIVILAAVAVPIYLDMRDRAQQGVTIGYAANLATAINQYNADPGNVVKITDATDWMTQDDVNDKLGDLTVKFTDDNYIEDAADRITIDTHNYVATVNTTIS